MRVVAAFFTLMMLVAAGWAAAELRHALAAPTPRAEPAEMARAEANISLLSEDASTALHWPALFGMPLPPAPPAPPAQSASSQESRPPAPPRPPLGALGYQLKGVVRAGEVVWGLVSHPSGDRIMRVGDALTDDMVIADIDKAGVWVDTGADQPELLGFPE